MNPLSWLIIAMIAYAMWKSSRTVRASQSAQERSVAIRALAAAWFLAFVFVVALIFSPDKVRVILLLPAFFAATALARGWRNVRTRLRESQTEKERVDFERMKRVN